MVDYASLAYKAKVKHDEDKLADERHGNLRTDPCAFFERVKAHLIEEMDMVNVELRKRGVPVLEQNHLPGFAKEMFLTYGTNSLCRVGLGIMGGGCRITAVICGPPNGYEISRKEFLCRQEGFCREVLCIGEAGLPTGVASPDEIAVDIISGVLVGRFY